MSAEEILQESESNALNNSQFVSHVTGKNQKMRTSKNLKSFGAAGFITAMIIVFMVIFSSGNLVPSAISERLIEETDVQYADAVASKEIVFQQALKEGSIPSDTAEILKRKGVLVGYMKDEGFVEANENSSGLGLLHDNKFISADGFIDEINNNIQLYDAFNEATYGRAAYYFDESADKVFKRIGTNRNNYTKDTSFDEVMEKKLGEGSDIDINSVSLIEKTRINTETGEEERYYEFAENGLVANSKDGADVLISEVSNKFTAGTTEEATINSADALKVADTITKEQRESLYYLLTMENISKMKAGEGNESAINDVMNYLYRNAEVEVVDVETGEIIKVSGSPMDSPSLAAILSGSNVEADKVKNYSSDRVLKLTENKLGVKNEKVFSGTVSSTSNNTKGTVGRFNNTGTTKSSEEVLGAAKPIIDSSLVNNSYQSLKGVNAGEFLVEGAINVGKELAKQSGAAAGDADAVIAYIRLNNSILAMDAKVERTKRSPFDITSRNTFLGSLVYDLAMLINSSRGNIMTSTSGLLKTTGGAIAKLMPSSYADATSGYLATFGDCETYHNIGAVGSAGCSQIATFDTSTLNDPFNDAGFIDFLDKNTTLNDSGARVIEDDSILKDYILYNNERTTPLGVIDGGFLDSLSKNSSSVSFINSIRDMIQLSEETSDSNKRIASGAAFVNSKDNPDWQTYKYAQRYVSLARASAALKYYTNDKTAYNMKYFEGTENPVTAFLNSYYASK